MCKCGRELFGSAPHWRHGSSRLTKMAWQTLLILRLDLHLCRGRMFGMSCLVLARG